jgi:hypothetical protein
MTAPTSAGSSLLVVYSDPVEGREQQFNDWYSHVHVRDVMRIRGSKAVQRFVRSERQQPGARPPGSGSYLAIYEIQDVDECITVHLDDVTTDRMPISDALDPSKSEDTFYVPLDATLDALESYQPPDAAGLVLVAFDAVVGREGEMAGWYSTSWKSSLARAGGAGAGHLYVKSGTQLMETGQRRFVGIYPAGESDQVAAGLADALRSLTQDDPIDGATCQLAHYQPVAPRLTAAEVRAASAMEQALEQRARLALGDQLHHFSLREIRKELGMAEPVPGRQR